MQKNIKIQKRIHQGKHEIFQGVNERNGLQLVLKVLPKTYPTPTELEDFFSEWKVTRQFKIFEIPQYEKVELSQYQFALGMDFRGEMALEDFLRKTKVSFEEKLEILLRIAKVVQKLHQYGYLHQQLSSHHLLIHPQTREVKLIDFQLCSPVEAPIAPRQKNIRLNLRYLSPEQTGLVLQDLLKKLMEIALTSAGAQIGGVFLEEEQELLLRVFGNSRVSPSEIQTFDPPLLQHEEICQEIVNYVYRTRKPVILSNGKEEGTFSHLPYMAQKQVKSLLCAPILYKKEFLGLLFLENRELEGTFTEERLEILRLLSTQATISLVNSRYYEKLQQNTRDLQQANQLKDEFLANTTHELKTPLNGIIGLVEVILEKEEQKMSPESLRNGALVIGSARRLGHLINDLLDFSRLKNHDIQLHLAPVDLRVVTDLVLHYCSPLIGNKSLQLKNEIPRDIPPVFADEIRIQQVLYNLIENAIKFSPEGEIKLGGEVKGEQVEIFIADTGIGIPRENRERIFREFEQGDGSITREKGGTGLGLSITKKLVELHGGQIHVESQVQLGTTFFFTLPLAPPNSSEEATRFLPSAFSEEDSWQKRDFVTRQKPAITHYPTEKTGENQIKILVVDDEPVNRQVLFEQLNAVGYRVMEAHDGYMALNQLEEEKPDLIILDLIMPRLSGYEVCRQIRNTYPREELPILILSAKNQIQDLVKGLEEGANDYLAKPYHKSELLARIRNLWEIRESAQRGREINRLQRQMELWEREVALHKSTQTELQNQQVRFLGLLNQFQAAIISFDDQQQVTFFNRQAERWFGYSSQEAIRLSVEVLFPGFKKKWDSYFSEEENREEVSKKSFSFAGYSKNRTKKIFQITIGKLELEEDEEYSLFLSEEVPIHFPSEEESPNQGNLKREEIIKSPEFKEKLVRLVRWSEEWWSKSTGKSRVELSEQSGLWKTQLDDSVYRTRTFDKYLNIDTIPNAKPKWGKVLRTAEFVIQECQPIPQEVQEEIERQIYDVVRLAGSEEQKDSSSFN